MITIIEANTKALLKEYVIFPFSLYKDHPYWVPPLIQDELEGFDKTKNPAFENAEATLRMYLLDHEILDKIAGLIKDPAYA